MKMILARKLLSITLVFLAMGGVLEARFPQQKFYDDDPIWVEPVTQDATQATRYERNSTYEFLSSIFLHPGEPVLGQRAVNINTVEEVPDGPFYMNRAGASP